jgi:hypothetical protein
MKSAGDMSTDAAGSACPDPDVLAAIETVNARYPSPSAGL